jgi:hypothetical protein
MNAEQIKDEIRKLSRIDKIEIYRWIDEEAAADLLSRIGIYRSLEARQETEQRCNVNNRKFVYMSDSLNDTDLPTRKQNSPSVVHWHFSRTHDR